MTLECPKCKSPVAREGQRFCYRCGYELNAYYDSLKLNVNPSGTNDPLGGAASGGGDIPAEAPPTAPKMPVGTVVLEANAFDTKIETPPATPPKASLKILLPAGDVFDRELTSAETQIGKGPRNDIVIADPAVSTAHAMVRLEGSVYTINDIGSRNGTFVNGERVAESHQLSHGDVIGIGLSKLTFRLSEHSETSAIELDVVAAASRPAVPPPLTEESLALAVVAAGLATKGDVDRVRSDAKGHRVYHALIEERLASEDSLRDLMSRTFQMPVIDLSTSPIDEAVVAEFPAGLAREHHVFAVSKEAEAIVLAVADPTDVEVVERVRREVRSPLSIRLATATQIREQADRHYAPKLIGVLPSGEKLEYVIDKHEVEIGKAAHNHIVLTDPTVSNTHAIVMAREAGYTIVDLGSRNGTFVNGERLGSQAHTLRHGDKIQLGQTVLTFRNPGETAANMTAVLSGEALEEVRIRAGVAEGGKRDTGETEKAAGPSLEPSRPQAAALAEISPPAGVTPAQADSDAIAADETSEDEKGGKKKKKKKKKGGDERMRAAYISGLSRIVAQVLGVVLAVMLALYVNNSMRSGSDKPAIETSSKGKAKVKLSLPSAGTPFQGGTFEASGAVYVPGSNGVLIVDDGRPGEVLWMQVDEGGRQVGPVKPIALGVTVDDPEGITSDGTYFYIIGSQSQPNAGERNALVRFAFDAASQSVPKAEALTNLRDFLIANVPELKGVPEKGSEGGLNIEGIAWDFKRGRWLLGLRSPLKDGSAFIVAIKLRNPAGAFSVDNLQLAEPNAMPLKLAGLGVRDIQYDPESNSFLVIAGAPEHHEKSEFTLWEWNGAVEQPGSESALRRLQDLDPKMKPEGITHVEIGGRKFILVVGDSSVYFKLDYAESQ
jgi:pSer/pThr/pTyr-binding forkhead associated (FHA) protein